MNRSRFRLEGRLVWVQGTVYWIGMHFGATWRIRLNDTIAGMETLLTVAEVDGATSSEGCLLPSSHRRCGRDTDRTVLSCLACMGVNATGTLGGSQVERRRENRGAVGGEGGLERGCAPSQKIYEFFISKWCDMLHYGCVIFKIHVSHGL